MAQRGFIIEHGGNASTGDAKISEIEGKYQLLKRTIEEKQRQLEVCVENFETAFRDLEDDVGEDFISSRYPDIRIYPEKYLNERGQKIIEIARLCVNAKKFRQDLEELEKEKDFTENLLYELKATLPDLIKELHILWDENSIIAMEKTKIYEKLNNFSTEVEEIANGFSTIPIDQFSKKLRKNIDEKIEIINQLNEEISNRVTEFKVFDEISIEQCTSSLDQQKKIQLEQQYQEIKQEISKIDEEISTITQKCTEGQQSVEKVIGKSKFSELYGEISTYPEKYLQNSGEIKRLAGLYIQKNGYTESRSRNIEIQENIALLIKEFTVTGPELVKELKNIRLKNKQISENYTALQKEFIDLQAQIKAFLEDLSAKEELINGCKQQVENYRIDTHKIIDTFELVKKHLRITPSTIDEIIKKEQAERRFEKKIAEFKHSQEIRSEHTSKTVVIATPNGQHVITGSQDGKIKVWNSKWTVNNTNEEKDDILFDRNCLPLPFEYNDQMSFTYPDSVYSIKCAYSDERNQSDLFVILGSKDKSVNKWNFETKQHTLIGKTDEAVHGVEISSSNSDGKRLIASIGYNQHKNISIWDQETRLTVIQSSYIAYIKDVSFYSNRKILAIGNDIGNTSVDTSIVRLFDIEKNVKIHEIQSFEGYRPCKVIGLKSLGYVISCSWQKNTIKIHDLRSKDVVREINCHSKGINDIKIYNTSHIISGSHDRTIKVFSITDEGYCTSFDNPGTIYSCCIDPVNSSYIMGITDKDFLLRVFSHKLD